MMEQSIEKLDFEETDQMVQVHGTFSLSHGSGAGVCLSLA
jgi:hypothetical protein